MNYLIFLICLGLPTYLIRFKIFGIPSTFLEVIIYLVFIIGLINYKNADLKNLKRFLWPVLLLLFGAGLSVFISADKNIALGQFKAYFIDPLLIFLLIVTYLRKEDFKWIFWSLIGSSLIVSGYSIYQKIVQNVTSDNRVVGIFKDSPNYVALFLAPIAVLIFAWSILTLRSKKYWFFLAYLLVSLLCFYAIYLSGSRSGLLAVIVGIFIFIICYFWAYIKARLWLKILIILIAVGSLTIGWLAFRPDFQASSGRVVSSNNVRWQIWVASVELVKTHPVLGVGLGNFQNAFSNLTENRVNFPELISPQALTPHNIFLMFYLTTGIFGFIAFIWLLILFYFQGSRNILIKETAVLVAAMSTLLIQGLVDTPYFKNDLSAIFWIIFASMFIINYKKND